MIITATVEVTPRRIADLMVTAIEGGIGYWCESVKCLSATGIFKVGEEYETVGGEKVRLIGVSQENRATTYETMYDGAGVHRYTTRDFGRVTGTDHKKPDPKNLEVPIWYDCEDIYLPGKPSLLIEVMELDPSSDKNKKGRWLVDLAKMEQAFILMQEFGKPKGWHWQNFITENDDSETADVWFQLAVFGEVVYG